MQAQEDDEMKWLNRILFIAALCAVNALALAGANFDSELLAIQQGWAVVNYDTPAAERDAEFSKLETRAAAFARANPDRAEPLVWLGIVQSSHAGAKGGLGALGLAKKARASLESALALDPNALDGSAYTSLGTLYYQVPGFPLGFGNKDKAQEFLRKALSLNPDGIDPNYFYADYLYEQGRYAESMQYLEHAAKAPARVGRERADEGRRGEIASLTARVKAKMG
jgi:tetratricopeptide (TPR) repeat protein